jgi:hypothetical protein
MDYFLLAREGWGISEQQLAQLLRAHWPSVRIEKITKPTDSHSIEFQLPMKESTLQGALNREGSTIIYFGAMRDCAEFALWYQSVVPPEGHPLLLFDEGYNRSIELQARTTVEDILEALGYIPPT